MNFVIRFGTVHTDLPESSPSPTIGSVRGACAGALALAVWLGGPVGLAIAFAHVAVQLRGVCAGSPRVCLAAVGPLAWGPWPRALSERGD